MQLWTWQTSDFSLTCGRVVHNRSEYYQTVPGVAVAYAELAQHVGTDQIIWCFVRQEKWLGDERVQWILNIPDDQIICFTNDYIWNKILRIKVRPPKSWLYDCPPEERINFGYIKRRLEDYHLQLPPTGGWWSQLFIDRSELRLDNPDQLASALVPHPIPESWVVHDGRKG